MALSDGVGRLTGNVWMGWPASIAACSSALIAVARLRPSASRMRSSSALSAASSAAVASAAALAAAASRAVSMLAASKNPR